MIPNSPIDPGSGPEFIDVQKGLEVFMPAIAELADTPLGANLSENTRATLLPGHLNRSDRQMGHREWDLAVSDPTQVRTYRLRQIPTAEGLKYSLHTISDEVSSEAYKEPTPQEAKIALGALGFMHAYIDAIEIID